MLPNANASVKFPYVLPISPPVKPMLASPVKRIPQDGRYVFEPKWDGFRCLVFRDGDEVTLQSRSGKPLERYFPEMVDALLAGLPERVVLDGELVVALGDRLSFDALTERIHPAASRIAKLAEETPARYVAFDLLAVGDTLLTGDPTTRRQQELAGLSIGGERVHRTPITADPAVAAQWFDQFEGAGLDGLIGKPADGTYQPNKRTMIKIKHLRTADCVIAGLRWHAPAEEGVAVGSLLLGLHDEAGVLHHVGVCGSFPAAKRRELAEEFKPLMDGGEVDHPWLGEHAADGRRLPGSINRWRSEENAWVPLRRERVVEVSYEHTEGGHPARFRHNGQFQRWRPDREPESCTYEQLEEPVSYDLEAVLS
jgi:ATP-dependent DNA ligase